QAEDGIRDATVTGVQTCALPILKGARHGRVLGALQDGAAVRKNRHFVRRDAKANEKIVLSNILDQRREPAGEGREVQSPAALVDLHRITPAKGDMRLRLSLEIGVIVLCAGPAFRIAGQADGLQPASPYVTREQPPMKGLGTAC